MGRGDEKRNNKGPEYTIDKAADGVADDAPTIFKIGSTDALRRPGQMNRRAFLKGTLTAGAGLVGVAGAIGSSGGGGSGSSSSPPPDPGPADNSDGGDGGSGNDSGGDEVTGPQIRKCGTTYHPSHGSSVYTLAYDNTGSRIASGSSNGSLVKVWDTASGELQMIYREHVGVMCKCVAFSPDGTRIASAGAKSVHIWEATTGNLISSYEMPGGPANHMDFSPDGAQLAVVATMPDTHFVDVGSGTLRLATEGRSEYNICVAFSPDGSTIASAGGDHSVYLWDVATGNLIHTYDGHSAPVHTVAFSPDSAQIVSAGVGVEGPHIWERETGNLITRYNNYETDSSAIYCIAFSPDGRTVACGDKIGRVDIWNAVSGDRQLRLSGHKKEISTLAYHPDGTRIATGSHDRSIRIWSIADGTLETLLGDRVIAPMTDEIDCAAGSDSGARIGCTCDVVCTCDTVCSCHTHSGGGGGGGHYWFPN